MRVSSLAGSPPIAEYLRVFLVHWPVHTDLARVSGNTGALSGASASTAGEFYSSSLGAGCSAHSGFSAIQRSGPVLPLVAAVLAYRPFPSAFPSVSASVPSTSGVSADAHGLEQRRTDQFQAAIPAFFSSLCSLQTNPFIATSSTLSFSDPAL